MSIRETLQTRQGKPVIDAIVKKVLNDGQKMSELAEVLFDGEGKPKLYAAWAFGDAMQEAPDQAKPFHNKMMKSLMAPDAEEAVIRNLLRVYQVCEIPEKTEGPLLDLCLRFIRSENYAIAVRAFAITVACRVCIKYKELARELLITLNELRQQPHSPALQVRIKRALKELSALDAT